jgi:hypothetical protein
MTLSALVVLKSGFQALNQRDGIAVPESAYSDSFMG